MANRSYPKLVRAYAAASTVMVPLGTPTDVYGISMRTAGVQGIFYISRGDGGGNYFGMAMGPNSGQNMIFPHPIRVDGFKFNMVGVGADGWCLYTTDVVE